MHKVRLCWAIYLYLIGSLCGNLAFAESTPGTGDKSITKTRSYGAYCGLYCIYFVSRYFDNQTEMEDLINPKYIVSAKGSTPLELETAIKDHGLFSYAAQNVLVNTLRNSHCFAIIHVRTSNKEFDHYQLFLGSRNGQALIMDPGFPIQNVTFQELKAKWDGNAIFISNKPIDIDSLFLSQRIIVLIIVFIGVAIILAIHAILRKRKMISAGAPLGKLVVHSFLQMGLIVFISTQIAFAYHFISDTGYLSHSSGVDYIQNLYRGSFYPRINKAELCNLITTLHPQIIDARLPSDYNRGHIEGAINLPVNTDIDNWSRIISTLNKSKKTVLYCQSSKCPFAEKVATRLFSSGFSDVTIYKNGWMEWKSALNTK
ncbi:MAG: rhodanese-like domain-containing protein [Candidatus Sumerlaeia bacterium]